MKINKEIFETNLAMKNHMQGTLRYAIQSNILKKLQNYYNSGKGDHFYKKI